MSLVKGPLVMTSQAYHEASLIYNMKGMLKEIKLKFPNDENIDLNDPKYKDIVKSMAYCPIIGGELAKTLGIHDRVLDLELHRDIANGWTRADLLPEGSLLLKFAEETPRGLMVPFRANSTKMNEEGEYVPSKRQDGKEKKIRQCTEFVPTLASNLSATLAMLSMEDPSVMLRLKNMAQEILEVDIFPQMLSDCIYKTDADGVTQNEAKEILYTAFLHIENRAEIPFIHFHVDLQNVCLGFDDELHSLSTDDFLPNISKMKTQWASKMKDRLEKEFGMVLERRFYREELSNEFLSDDDRNIVSYDIPDEFVPEKVRGWMKGRQDEIDEHIKKHGKDMTAAEREFARLESRDEKTEMSPSELQATWKAKFDELGWTADEAKSHLNFNQVRSGNLRIQEPQLVKNYERFVGKKAARKIDPMLRAYKKNSKKKDIDEEKKQKLIEAFIRKQKEVDFNETQFISHMVLQLIDTHDTASAHRIAAKMFEDNCVGMMHKSQAEYFSAFLNDKITDLDLRKQFQMRYKREVRFTTKTILAQEQYISESLKARVNETQFVFDRKEVVKFILMFEEMKTQEFRKKDAGTKPFKFEQGQRDAIIDSLTLNGAICNIAGRAGAGKSTLLECVNAFYETKGFRMFGASTSSTATNGLAESVNLDAGNYANCAKLLYDLRNGKVKFTDKTILTIDEAGMMDMEQLHDILKFVNEAKAKLLLVGEVQQLQAISHGSVFRILSDQFGFSSVKDINRQKESWQREVVEGLATGRSGESMKTLFDHDKIVITKTDEQRAERLVEDYLTTLNQDGVIREEWYSPGGKKRWKEKPNLTPHAFQKKLIIAATNADVEMINGMVRAQLKKDGFLKEDAVAFECKDEVKRGFTEGDRVVFTKSTKTVDADPLKIANSETGEVKGFVYDKEEAVAMKIRLDTGKDITIKINGKPPAIRHSFATTVHKSQGQTKENAFYYVSKNLNSLHQAYVACSRHRNEVKVYLSDQMADELSEKMGDRSPTPAMVAIATSISKQKKIPISTEDLESFDKVRGFLNEYYVKYDEKGLTRHRMDDFTAILESMAQTQFKRSTYDFDLLDGKAMNAYKEEYERRKEILANPNKYSVSKLDVPLSQVKVVLTDTIESKPIKLDEKTIAKARHVEKFKTMSDIPQLFTQKKQEPIVELEQAQIISIKKKQKMQGFGLTR